MNEFIDGGKTVYKKYFDNPKKLKDIEGNFDNKIRALTLIEYIKNNKKIKYPNLKFSNLPYYIAHRTNTLRNCDVIFKLEKGKLADKGNYNDLLSKEKNLSI